MSLDSLPIHTPCSWKFKNKVFSSINAIDKLHTSDHTTTTQTRDPLFFCAHLFPFLNLTIPHSPILLISLLFLSLLFSILSSTFRAHRVPPFLLSLSSSLLNGRFQIPSSPLGKRHNHHLNHVVARSQDCRPRRPRCWEDISGYEILQGRI